MFCQKCGAKVADGSAFCGSCGTQVTTQYQQPMQQSYQQPMQQSYQQPTQWSYGQPYQQPYYQPYPQGNYQQPLSMGWFNFLIYFSLFAGAVMNALSSIQILTGLHYGGTVERDLVYGMFGGLQVVDIIYGICVLLVAVFGVVTRFSLSGYRSIGPKLLTTLYVLCALVNLFYIISLTVVVDGVVDLTESVATVITQIIISIVMIIINYVYFKKRAYMFVN